LDFGLLRSPPPGLPDLEGAPEIVLEYLPLAASFGGMQVAPVGPVHAPPDVTQQQYLDYLCSRITVDQATVVLFRRAGRCL
jgi:hypothetical protein